VARARVAVAGAVAGDLPGVEQALRQEELAEREADREHWKPLIEELGRLRRQR